MFNIMENIYDGWQYLINVLSIVGGNFHLVIENIPKFSQYISSFFENFSVPSWVYFTIIGTLGFGLVFKFCHWG